MSVLVSVIAIVGVIYFNYQDKKQAKKITHKYINKPFLTRRKAALKKPSSLPKGRVLSFSLLFQFRGKGEVIFRLKSAFLLECLCRISCTNMFF